MFGQVKHLWLMGAAMVVAACMVHESRSESPAGPSHTETASEPSFVQGTQRPNIVLIVADDLGFGAVGYNGGFAETPNIDRIASSGARLDRFYVYPVCSPTRAGLMTGEYPIRFGMARGVVRPSISYGLPPEKYILPERLRDAGYEARGAIGKWHLGHLKSQWHPINQGFTYFKGHYNGAVDYWKHTRSDVRDWHVMDEPVEEKGYNTGLIGEAASQFIREHAEDDAPYFAYVPFLAPHTPLQAPKRLLRKYRHLDPAPNDGQPSPQQRLAAMVEALDENVGEILNAIEESGEASNTIIWFMSDNGGIPRTRIPENNGQLRGAKGGAFEGGIRVPPLSGGRARLRVGR